MLLNNSYTYSTSTSTLIANKSNSNSTSTCSSLKTKSQSSSLNSNFVNELNIPRKNSSTTVISLTNVNSLLINNSTNNINQQNELNQDFLFDNTNTPFIPIASNPLNDIAASFHSSLSSSNSSYIPSTSSSSLQSQRSCSYSSTIPRSNNSGCLSTTPSLASILTSKKSSSYLNRLSKSHGTNNENNKLNFNLKSSSFTDLSFSNSLHSNISANSTISTIFESSPNSSSFELSYTPSVASWTRPSQLSTCQVINTDNDLHPLMEKDIDNEFNNNPNDEFVEGTSLSSSSCRISDNESVINKKNINNQNEIDIKKSKKTRASKFVAKSLSFISLLAESTRKSALLMNASAALSFNTRITDTRAMYYSSLDPENIHNGLIEENNNNNNNNDTTSSDDEYDDDDEKSKQEIEELEPLSIQLTTFKTTLKPSSLSLSNISSRPPNSALMFKSREPRLNSQFLRFYAQDYSAKSKGLLSVTDYEIDLYQEEQEKLYYKMTKKDQLSINSDNTDSSDETSSIELQQDQQQQLELINEDTEDDYEYKTLLKLGYLSREKLWSNVILAPREDKSSFNNQISYSDYKFIEDEKFVSKFNNNSLTRLNGECIPWMNYKNYNETKNHKFIKPYGYLPNQIQFTVKGWANKRWIENNE